MNANICSIYSIWIYVHTRSTIWANFMVYHTRCDLLYIEGIKLLIEAAMEPNSWLTTSGKERGCKQEMGLPKIGLPHGTPNHLKCVIANEKAMVVWPQFYEISEFWARHVVQKDTTCSQFEQTNTRATMGGGIGLKSNMLLPQNTANPKYPGTTKYSWVVYILCI